MENEDSPAQPAPRLEAMQTCFGRHSLPRFKPGDPARIPVLMAELQDQWLRQPELRLTQLLSNLIQPEATSQKVFNCEDDQLLRLLRDL